MTTHELFAYLHVDDAFYGERSGAIVDPFGHRRNIGHSIENVEPAEMQSRYTKLLAEQSR